MIIPRKFNNGVATNSLLLMVVSVLTTICGLANTKLLSLNFSLNDYGTYSQSLLVVSTGTSLSILGLTNAVNYFFNRTQDHNEQKKYISTIFFIQYCVGLLCTIFILLFRGFISDYFKNPRLSSILLFVAFMPVLINLSYMYQTLFVAIGRAKDLVVRNIIFAVIRVVTTYLICVHAKSIVIVLIVVLVLDFAQYFYFSLVFNRVQFRILMKCAEIRCIKEILAFSIPMSIYVLTNSLSRDIDKYVISFFSNTEALAIYSNAAKILPFDLLTASFITVLIPVITKFINNQQYSEAKNIFKLYLRVGYILTFIFAGGAVAIAKHLMIFLYDVKYLPGLSIFVIYLFIDMIRFANVTTLLSGSGKTKLLMRISVITLALNGVLNVVAFKLLGIIGPAITTLLLTIGMTIALLHYGAIVIQSRIIELFNIKEILIISAEITCFGFLIYFLSNYLSSLQMPNFFVIAISYGAFLIALLWINFKRISGIIHEMNTIKS